MTDDPAPSAPSGFDGLLADLWALTETGDALTLHALLSTLGARGHGPIMGTLAALMMLPTGMLPLMPAAIGVLLALTAVEMIVGGKGVSVPPRIGRIVIGATRLRGALRRVAPLCRRLGRVLHPRWSALVQSGLSLMAIALILLASAAALILIGAIPGLPFVLCIPALLFGLGLTAGDGAVVAAGFVATLLPLWFVIALIPRLAALWS